MSDQSVIIWFRQDLRLHDNLALLHAVHSNCSIIPIFILDDENAGDWKYGGASRWWLHESLKSLQQSLQGNLLFFRGKADDIIPRLVTKFDIRGVYWNRCYEPWRTNRDAHIKGILKTLNVDVRSFNSALLWEPWEVKKNDGSPYKVFTPFYRKGCLSLPSPAYPIPINSPLNFSNGFAEYADLGILQLLPQIPWYSEMIKHWSPGEISARKKLLYFLEHGLKNYKDSRNRPDYEGVSQLSPHLHFGEISPREVWHSVREYGIIHGLETDVDHFCSELGWREFSHSLLYYNHDLTHIPIQKKFIHFPWSKNSHALDSWQKGLTGIPIVDAGMRQLWRTGWMHNRVRMITASFLIKNLLIPWQDGQFWFWDCLVDANLANNAASWQWVAGCGADAAPYFRIFNPVTQGQKFDPEGKYVKTFVPELLNLPIKYIHNPWDAPPSILKDCGVILGDTYPLPLVDLAASRQKALEAFQQIK